MGRRAYVYLEPDEVEWYNVLGAWEPRHNRGVLEQAFLAISEQSPLELYGALEDVTIGDDELVSRELVLKGLRRAFQSPQFAEYLHVGSEELLGEEIRERYLDLLT